jgi:ferric-dicitrate binding protein FerR (iron transport regulator)
MRFRTLVAAGLGAGLAVAPALAEDGYQHGRVRFVEPGVTLQRATEVSAEEALANVPFLPGDRVWTDSAGRAEFQFPDGTVVRLDRRSKLDYAGHEEGQSERIVLRLWSGSVLVRVRTRDFVRFEVETPAGMVQALDRGIVRVDVEAGETRVSVYAGEAELDDGRERARLAAGERTYVRWGGQAEEPQRFDPAEGDDFAQWDDMRESERPRWPPPSTFPTPRLPRGRVRANGRWGTRAQAWLQWYPTSTPAGSVLERAVE